MVRLYELLPSLIRHRDSDASGAEPILEKIVDCFQLEHDEQVELIDGIRDLFDLETTDTLVLGVIAKMLGSSLPFSTVIGDYSEYVKELVPSYKVKATLLSIERQLALRDLGRHRIIELYKSSLNEVENYSVVRDDEHPYRAARVIFTSSGPYTEVLSTVQLRPIAFGAPFNWRTYSSGVLLSEPDSAPNSIGREIDYPTEVYTAHTVTLYNFTATQNSPQLVWFPAPSNFIRLTKVTLYAAGGVNSAITPSLPTIGFDLYVNGELVPQFNVEHEFESDNPFPWFVYEFPFGAVDGVPNPVDEIEGPITGLSISMYALQQLRALMGILYLVVEGVEILPTESVFPESVPDEFECTDHVLVEGQLSYPDALELMSHLENTIPVHVHVPVPVCISDAEDEVPQIFDVLYGTFALGLLKDQYPPIGDGLVINVDCTHDCQSSCQDRCEVLCEANCQSDCETACQAACEDDCQIACESFCQQACEADCENVCQSYCQLECETGGCQSNCQTTCQEACMSACQSGSEMCLSSCQQSAVVTDCMSACEHSCQSKSQAGCDAPPGGPGGPGGPPAPPPDPPNPPPGCQSACEFFAQTVNEFVTVTCKDGFVTDVRCGSKAEAIDPGSTTHIEIGDPCPESEDPPSID